MCEDIDMSNYEAPKYGTVCEPEFYLIDSNGVYRKIIGWEEDENGNHVALVDSNDEKS